MSAIDFPANPGSLTPPNYWTANSGVQYRWDGEKWVSTGGSATYIGMGGTGANFVTGDIKFSDTKGVKFGTDDDLAIYHDGTNNYIDFDTGELRLSVAGTSKMTLDSSGAATFASTAKFGSTVSCGSSDFSGPYTYIASNEIGLNTDSTTSKFKVASNGNVTFAGDLTINTDALFVDASAKSVGIGSSSPGGNLTITDASTYTIDIKAHPNGDGALLTTLGNSAALTLGTNSTERMRIDSSGKVGIGETSPSADLVVLQNGSTFTTAATTVALFQRSEYTGSTSRISIVSGNAAASHINFGDIDDEDVGNIVYDHTSNYLEFSTNTSPAMRIDSSGKVGIGTTNPPTILTISNSGAEGFEFGHTSGTVELSAYNRSTDERSPIKIIGQSVLLQTGNPSLANGLYQDASGNVGIGTASPSVLLHIAANDPQFYIQDSNGTGDAVNATLQFRDSSNSQLSYLGFASGSDSHLSLFNTMSGGDLRLGTASTERMRIDSSGYVHIGDSTASAHADRLLQIGKTDRSATYLELRTSTSGVGGVLFSDGTAGGDSGYRGTIEYNQSGDYMIFKTAATERMRIDNYGTINTGQRLVATRSSASQSGDFCLNIETNSQVSWVYDDAAKIVWHTGVDPSNSATSVVNRMQLDHNGTFYINTQNNTNYGQIDNTRNNSNASGYSGNMCFRSDVGALMIATDADSGWAPVYINKYEFNMGDDNRLMSFAVSGTVRGAITWDNTDVIYGTGSDYRIKKNVRDFTDGIDMLSRLKVRKFDFIDNEIGIDKIGFIAHELQEIIPEAVSGKKDAMRKEEDTGNDVMNIQMVDYGKVTPVLTAALQEALVRIKTLETEVSALKGS